MKPFRCFSDPSDSVLFGHYVFDSFDFTFSSINPEFKTIVTLNKAYEKDYLNPSIVLVKKISNYIKGKFLFYDYKLSNSLIFDTPILSQVQTKLSLDFDTIEGAHEGYIRTKYKDEYINGHMGYRRGFKEGQNLDFSLACGYDKVYAGGILDYDGTKKEIENYQLNAGFETEDVCINLFSQDKLSLFGTNMFLSLTDKIRLAGQLTWKRGEKKYDYEAGISVKMDSELLHTFKAKTNDKCDLSFCFISKLNDYIKINLSLFMPCTLNDCKIGLGFTANG